MSQRTIKEKGAGPPEEMVRRVRDEQIRRQTLRQVRSRNLLVASAVMGAMGAIYVYTLKVTKQENFLDKDFDQSAVRDQRSNQAAPNTKS